MGLMMPCRVGTESRGWWGHAPLRVVLDAAQPAAVLIHPPNDGVQRHAVIPVRVDHVVGIKAAAVVAQHAGDAGRHKIDGPACSSRRLRKQLVPCHVTLDSRRHTAAASSCLYHCAPLRTAVRSRVGSAHAIEVPVGSGGVLVEGRRHQAREHDAGQQAREEVGRVDLAEVPAGVLVLQLNIPLAALQTYGHTLTTFGWR